VKSAQPIRFVLPDFEGPLDLLLHLIEAAKVEITRIALLDIIDQFLAFVRSAPERDLEQASAFVVMASTLLMIKSRSLLPVHAPEPIEQEQHVEDVEAIVEQLHEYKRIKALAAVLAARDAHGQLQYSRERLAIAVEQPTSAHPLEGITIQKLVSVARTVARTAAHARMFVDHDRVTIQQRIGYVRTQLRIRGGEVWWSQLIADGPSRLTVVVTWMALLELVHEGTCACDQKKPFADIALRLQGQR
jgi:segregation and condensation protein A